MVGAALTVGCAEPAPPLLPVLPAIGRPEGVSQGPRVAVIVALRGDVTVEPSQGGSFAGSEQLQLLRDDSLRVGPGSFVMVALHNGHVVRLNEASALRIDALAPFADAPAGDDLEDRLAALLSPTEREDAALRGAITRVAGWNTRMTAAETIAPLPRVTDPPPPERVKEPVEPDGIGALGGVEAPATKSGEPQTDEPMKQPTQGADAEDADRTERPRPGKTTAKGPPSPVPPADAPSAEAPDDSTTEEKAKPSTDDKKAPDRKDSSSAAGDLPGFVMHTPDGGGATIRTSLPGPLVSKRLELARCAGVGAVIRGRITGKKLVELRVDGAASTCVPELLGKGVGLSDGWIEMTVLP